MSLLLYQPKVHALAPSPSTHFTRTMRPPSPSPSSEASQHNCKQNFCHDVPECPGANAIFQNDYMVHNVNDKVGKDTWHKELVVDGGFTGEVSIDIFAPLPLKIGPDGPEFVSSVTWCATKWRNEMGTDLSHRHSVHLRATSRDRATTRHQQAHGNPIRVSSRVGRKLPRLCCVRNSDMMTSQAASSAWQTATRGLSSSTVLASPLRWRSTLALGLVTVKRLKCFQQCTGNMVIFFFFFPPSTNVVARLGTQSKLLLVSPRSSVILTTDGICYYIITYIDYEGTRRSSTTLGRFPFTCRQRCCRIKCCGKHPCNTNSTIAATGIGPARSDSFKIGSACAYG